MGCPCWTRWGINRADGHRTAPTAMACQEIDLSVALPGGAYLSDPRSRALHLVAARDVRSVTGYQDFVDEAPLDLVSVVAQNVYLFAASGGLTGPG